MLIAHAPVGYLLGTTLRRWMAPGVVPMAVAGGLFPDIDMLMWFAIPSIHHHAWPTHWPIVWITAGALLAPAVVHPVTRARATLLSVFVASAFLHLVLDTLAGDVRWLAPLSDQAWSWVHVTRRFDPWWLNFVLHPTFAAEIVLVGLAGVVYATRR